jgi:antitoxin (DNA-binding transcriptional repressor) of toxin-antitoxin stability system
LVWPSGDAGQDEEACVRGNRVLPFAAVSIPSHRLEVHVSVPAIDLSEATRQLRDLVEQATRAGEVVLTRGGQIVARIVPVEPQRKRRQPGSARGLVHMAEDFDATPDDFRDYL